MERWSSGIGFLLASISAAVGLGNVWRFSAVVGQNGGGAYLVPYLFAGFAFALPLLVFEFAIGRDLRVDVVSAFESVDRRFGTLGWVVAGSVLVILSYYLVITGWVLAFFFGTVGGLEIAFESFTGSYWPIASFLGATLLTGGIVTLGIRGGIERMAKVVMPVIFLILVGLAAYGTTLSGFDAGIAFLLTPDVEVLSDPLLWSAAVGQVFFSLSVGQGIMLTYGSYLDEGTDLVRSALVITVADIGVAVLSGVVIFPIVFTFGLEPAAGAELAFSTLPRGFAAMPAPAGRIAAVGFFGLLAVAALSSAVAMLEVGVASLLRTTRLSRRRASGLMTAGMLALGLPSALSYSAAELRLGTAPVLDVLDESVGTLGLPLTALLIVVVFGWYQAPERTTDQLGTGVLRRLVTYVIPPVVLAITSLRVLSGTALLAGQSLPGRTVIGVPTRAIVTVAIVLALLVIGWVVVRYTSRYGRWRWGPREWSESETDAPGGTRGTEDGGE